MNNYKKKRFIILISVIKYCEVNLILTKSFNYMEAINYYQLCPCIF